MLDLVACRVYLPSLVIYHPIYSRLGRVYIPLLVYRADLGVTRLPLGHLVNIFLG